MRAITFSISASGSFPLAASRARLVRMTPIARSRKRWSISHRCTCSLRAPKRGRCRAHGSRAHHADSADLRHTVNPETEVYYLR